MSEQKPYKITPSEFYAFSNVSLPESTDEVKEFLFEVNNSLNEAGKNQNESDKSADDTNQNNQNVNLIDVSKFSIDQSVINSIFSSSEKNKDIIIQNYQNKDKSNLQNPNVINLINLDQELIQNNKKIRIIENAFCGNSRLETNIESKNDNSAENNENPTSKKPDVNLITIDKDYINSSESGNITIIQNVPLLIINHNCCDSESFKLTDSKIIRQSQDNDNIEITTLSTSFKNAKEFENNAFEAEAEAEAEEDEAEGEVETGNEIEDEGERENDYENRSQANQSLNEEVETTLITHIETIGNNDQDNTEYTRDSEENQENKENNDETGSNRNQENDSNHDNSWSVTSFHHYEEVAVEEDIESKSSSSQESSIHLGENNEVASDEEAEKFNTIKNKIDEMLAKLDKKNQVSEKSNQTDEKDEPSRDKSQTSEPEKSSKKPKCDEKDDTDSDDTLDCEKSKKKKKARSPCPSDISKPYTPQGCPKRDVDSPLLDSIDRIKSLLTDLLLDSPNNRRDNLRKNRCCNQPNQPNDCNKSSIRFVFPQINIKQSEPVNNNSCKKSSSKLPFECPNSNKKNNCSAQNKKQQPEPIWVLTRVTKHVTRTVRRESVPCP